VSLSGGCGCGAIRFRAGRVGRASICHCRMCQKTFGGFFGPYVDAFELEWTRGAPKYFQSSNQARRGFCGDCGTQLSFQAEGSPPNIAIGAFDDPRAITPELQIGLDAKLPYVDGLADLPHRSAAEEAEAAPYYANVVSRQHPDHDTETWPPKA
jgi:hypothetical protein